MPAILSHFTCGVRKQWVIESLSKYAFHIYSMKMIIDGYIGDLPVREKAI